MGENPRASAVLPQPVSGGESEGDQHPWTDQSLLGLLADALKSECLDECCDCDLEVRDRVAYLRGTVSSMAHKRAMARAAKGVPRLRAIVNLLRVTPLSPRSDQHIALDVQAALAKAGLTARVRAVNVKDGVVYLSGRVGSAEAKGVVEDAASLVPGVEEVVNNIRVKAPCPRKDEEILSDVELALGRYLGPGSRRIRAEVREGVVYLRGDLDSEYQGLLTENAVAWIPRVVDVVNELLITYRPPI